MRILRDALYWTLRAVAWLILTIGFRLDVSGRGNLPARGAFLLASNHVSYLDPVALAAACPRRLEFIAREDLFRVGWLGWFLRVMGVACDSKEGTFAMRQMLRALQSGRSVAIFPEGGLQMSGEPGAVAAGISWLAERAGVPIVPVLVQGTYQVMPPKTLRLRPGKIRVAFGSPIQYSTERFSGTPTDAVAGAVTDAWRHLGDEPAGKQKGSS